MVSLGDSKALQARLGSQIAGFAKELLEKFVSWVSAAEIW
jgi:hypothetical protein